MESMSTRARDWACFCLLAMGAACLGAEEKGADPVIGGVYAARELSEDSWTSREAAWPMAGLRVDDGRLGTLLVKYTVGAEQNGDADFRYESDCDCYRSKEDLRFAILGDSGGYSFKDEEVFLKFRPGELDLWYFEDDEKRGPYVFRMTYVDTVDLSTHRDPYYNWDGFDLLAPATRQPDGPLLVREVMPCRRLGSTRGGEVRTAERASGPDPEAGTSFRDCADCPEMVVIPAGRFRMGCEPDRAFSEKEQPAREVRIARRFALAKYETTFAQWDACAAGGGCDGYLPDDHGEGWGDRPVINVNWRDARKYALWLSEKTGKRYRLPSEAEWEYAARAGSTTRYSWGDDIGPNWANFELTSREEPWALPVGMFRPNAFGLHDMHGNVSEWVEDCWNYTYDGAPSGGSAWLSGDCGLRVTRGGAWAAPAHFLRSAYRSRGGAGLRNPDMGFRVALTLPE